MEIMSGAFLSALLAIVLIDLVLAGDNALVIGLVARELPKEQQKKVIYWGTAGAIIIRAVMAIVVVWLLKIPGFLVIGGLALVWIARQLVTPSANAGKEVAAHGAVPAKSLASAIKTIVIADAVMGVDNVLAIGGAAQGSMLLIVLGLLISVPIIVWGSQLVIKLVDRFPVIIVAGGAVLAWTAYKMVTSEPLLKAWLAATPYAGAAIGFVVFTLSLAPWYARWLPLKYRSLALLPPALALWWLGFEAVGDILKLEIGTIGGGGSHDYAMQAVRWLGWLPFALAWLMLCDRRRAATG